MSIVYEKQCYCAIKYNLIILKEVGPRCFYVINRNIGKPPLECRRKSGMTSVEWKKWRHDIIEYWEKHDRERMNAIRGARRI